VEMPLADRAPCALANDREGLRHQIVRRLPVVEAGPELRRLFAQLVVAQVLDLELERVDELRDRLEVLELASLAEVRDLVQHQRDQALPRGGFGRRIDST